MPSPDARPKLVALLRKSNENVQVRISAANALGQIGRIPEAKEKAAEGLAEALKDKDSRVRETSADSLGQIGFAGNADEKVVNSINELLSDEREAVVLVKAGWALARIATDLQVKKETADLQVKNETQSIRALEGALKKLESVVDNRVHGSERTEGEPDGLFGRREEIGDSGGHHGVSPRGHAR